MYDRNVVLLPTNNVTKHSGSQHGEAVLSLIEMFVREGNQMVLALIWAVITYLCSISSAQPAHLDVLSAFITSPGSPIIDLFLDTGYLG